MLHAVGSDSGKHKQPCFAGTYSEQCSTSFELRICPKLDKKPWQQ
jgi:hypothetical protein